MELLDRYLQSVRKYLPMRRQDDIIAELRANMESQIEDKEAELGRPLTQGEFEDLLRKMGPPFVVASRYQPQQYVIGPTFFPMYLYVLRIALLWAFVICAVVTAVVTPLTTPGATAIVQSALRIPGILLQVAAWITLVFAALEFMSTRYPDHCLSIPGITEKWNPSSLPPLEPKPTSGKPRSYAQAVAEFIFSVLFLVWLVLIPRYPFLILGPGAAYLQAGPFQLTPVWWTFFWCVVGLNALQLIWRAVDLMLETWARPSRIQQIAFKVMGIVPIAVVLLAPSQIYVTLKNPGVDLLHYGQNLTRVNQGLHLAFAVICGIVVLQLVIELGQWALEAYRRRETVR